MTRNETTRNHRTRADILASVPKPSLYKGMAWIDARVRSIAVRDESEVLYVCVFPSKPQVRDAIKYRDALRRAGLRAFLVVNDDPKQTLPEDYAR